MPAEPLTLLEREEIRVGIERADLPGVIAGVLGRHRCTVNSEIARIGGRDAYQAVAAQERADHALFRPKQARRLPAQPLLRMSQPG